MSAAKISFFTVAYDDLFTVATELAGSLDSRHLQEAGRPLLISVRGTYADGKTIMPDTMRNRLMDPDCAVQLDIGHVWKGLHKGQPIEINFVNAAMPGATRKWAHALQARRHGGIAFKHNCEVFARTADIDIILESKNGRLASYGDLKQKEAAPELRTAFSAASAHHPWARYFEITARDPRLLQTSALMQTLNGLTSERFHRNFLPLSAQELRDLAPALTAKLTSALQSQYQAGLKLTLKPRANDPQGLSAIFEVTGRTPDQAMQACQWLNREIHKNPGLAQISRVSAASI